MAASMASAAGSSKDDDDEVVQELDVYISKALADNLYLLQYPHRPVGRSYNEDQCVAARVKPKQHKVELEFALNTHDPSYDRLRGEQFAANADGSGDRSADQKPVFKSTMMDRQLLTSTKSTSSAENYAVGILRPGELHLSPLSAIVQMMPSFPHLDQSDKKAKAAEAATEERKRSTNQRQSPYGLPTRRRTEPRRPSEMSGVERAMLVCPQMDRDESELPKTLQDYFKDLVIENTGTKAPVKSSQELSMHALSRLPIQDQIKAVLMSAKVVDFAKLMSALPPKSDATSVVRFLQQVALLVQGCWVVKSDVLYRKDSFSPKTGVPADTLCRARDFLMFLFTQSRFVTQTKFADTVRLPVIDVKTLLEEMAKPTPDGWEFMLPYDRDFVARYPDVVQRQQMLWDAKQQFLSKSFRLSRQEAQDTLMQSPPAGTKGRQQKRRARSRNDSTASDGSGSDSGLMTNGQDVLSKASGSMLSKAAGPATKLSKASRSSTTSSAKAAH
ncbi:hypothetical protein HPB49_015643 [Dermacentor silvarum]|uniref:Uncharacterized protein n=1 Tax=Dermacentor silvarum TaxID=543639 RepID=A0ACB8CS36_DERSI|nr:hypothetical protein HPB49_015643 [Dermacentor silvarum]